jgi:hypothetical protein
LGKFFYFEKTYPERRVNLISWPLKQSFPAQEPAPYKAAHFVTSLCTVDFDI